MKPEIADNRQRASRADGCPLYVDLDGTLIATDMLWEALRALLRERPASIAMGPLWLTRGRARLKGEWAERLRVPVDMLPYRASVLAYIEQARAAGRPVVLASASPRRWVEDVARHLDIFDDVLATDGDVNLKARAKGDAIEAHLAAGGHNGDFEYLGDSTADVEIWRRAGRATLVAGSHGLDRR
ncbi:MAG: HAD-IA family hydrolase, partial [Actinomycetota bacterium]|nr:HAD-IA family hydrolase [Actinomycetota bacterium]